MSTHKHTHRINGASTEELVKDLTAIIPQLEAGYKCTVRPRLHVCGCMYT